MVSAVTTLGTIIAMTVTITPMPRTYSRSSLMLESDSPDSWPASAWSTSSPAPRPNRRAIRGTTSTRATVAEAISAPEAVDIMAATPAASTMPPSPSGR